MPKKTATSKKARHRHPAPDPAFALANSGVPDAAFRLTQAEGVRRLTAKVPAWAAVAGLICPPRLALEQCSGEAAARYKAEQAKRLVPGGGVMADLTGGYGVDFAFLAPHFARAIYVERQAGLCDVARHNFPRLGLAAAEIHQADGTALLDTLPALDLLYLDPARRDGAGRKTVLVSDCTPDVGQVLPRLTAKARVVMVKLSPMLDISRAIEILRPAVAEVHVVAAGGECKELLLVLRDVPTATPELFVAEGDTRLRLLFDDEAKATAPLAAAVGAYLYEPGAAVLKAGLFKWVAAHYGLSKLHPNTHLYTADTVVSGFPGRAFRVAGVSGFSKASLRALCAATPRANLAVRNFPGTVADLRRRLKVADGGEAYWFATTLADGTHAIIDCRRLQHSPKDNNQHQSPSH